MPFSSHYEILSHDKGLNSSTFHRADIKPNFIQMENEMNDLVSSIPANLQNTGSYKLDCLSFAGRVNVTENDSDYFYWFFESCTAKLSADVAQIPLVIWLNGGPGSSSSVGLFLENGPLGFKNSNVVTNPYSWNEKVHMLYWDQPVGTGFTTGLEYAENEDDVANYFHKALVQFFDKHPRYKGCPLYVTGESYAGKYVPYISTQLSQDDSINLQGIAIGDGWMKPQMQIYRQLIYGYEMGFIDSKQKAMFTKMHDTFCNMLREKESNQSTDKFTWTEVVNFGNSITQGILKCGGNPDIYDVRRWADVSLDTLSRYLNHSAVKEAINVPTELKWSCSDDVGPVYEGLISDNMIDVPDSVFTDLLVNYKMLFYTGNFDMSCGYTGTEIMLQEINYQTQWNDLDRQIWGYPDGSTMGYIKSLDKLTQIVIPDAGHLVPISKPEISREMLYKWIFDEDFPVYQPLAMQKEEKELLTKH